MITNINKGKVILSTVAQFDALVASGSIVIGGQTIVYDPDHYDYWVLESINYTKDEVDDKLMEYAKLVLLAPAYDSTTAYVVGDLLTYEEGFYECIVNSTGNIPTNTTYFKSVDISDVIKETITKAVAQASPVIEDYTV